MLRAILNISWRERPTKEQLYGKLSPISEVIPERRLPFAGHCFPSKDELISDIILRILSHRNRSVERPLKTYVDQLISDSRLTLEDLPTAIMDV